MKQVKITIILNQPLQGEFTEQVSRAILGDHQAYGRYPSFSQDRVTVDEFDTEDVGNYDAIIRKIRAVREQKNYKQEYLAEMLKVSQNAYSKIEIGITKLTVQRLFDIAKILDVRPEILLLPTS